MLVLEGLMALLVAVYYWLPAGAVFLGHFAAWQHAGGVLGAGAATAVAGGLLSEISIVYFQDKGRWSLRHFEHAGFKLGLFFLSGVIVYEFYLQQAVWFGNGPGWRVLLPKVLADQFGYTVFWSVPSQTLLTRWHDLHYSGRRLRRELVRTFVTERMLPVLVTNWMFWIPGVSLIYAMPSNLQTSLFIFATATWGLLLPAVTRQADGTGTLNDLVPSPS